MKYVQASDADTRFDKWLEQVENGETLGIVRDGKVIAIFRADADGNNLDALAPSSSG